MSKSVNAEIFKDTEKQCKTNERLKQSIAKSNEKQMLYLESSPIPAEAL